jgi:hypothetical protein
VKLYGLFRRELLAVFVNLEEIVRSSASLCTASLGFCLIKSIDDLIDVIKHQYVHSSANSVVQSHSEILVDSSSADCHFS